MTSEIAIMLLVILFLILIAVKIYNLANPKIEQPTKKEKKNKYHNPQNNYFKNNPDHTDITHEYIESIWEEMKNK